MKIFNLNNTTGTTTISGNQPQSEIQTLIDAGNTTLVFTASENYNYSNLSITGDNVTFNLNGATLNSSSDSNSLIKSGGGDNFRIYNGKLNANTQALNQTRIAGANGIKWNSDLKIKVSDIEFRGFRDAGMRVGGAGSGSNSDRLYHISSCEFYGCYIGFINEQDAEYGIITDCHMNACGIAGINNSGNWLWSNIGANYCGNGIVHTSFGSNFHTLTGNTVHGAMTNIQINHVSSGSKFATNRPVITIDGINYTSFGFLGVGLLPSPINGLTCYYADIKVLGNTDVGFQISDLIIQNAEIDGGNDLGITLTGITERRFVTKTGKVYEIPRSVVTVPPTKLVGYNVDVNTPNVGEDAIKTSPTSYTDFFATSAAEASKFIIQVEPVTGETALYLNDNNNLNPQMKSPLTTELGEYLENNGGFVEIEFIKDSNRGFGGLWIDLPSGNFNVFINIYNDSIQVATNNATNITNIDNTDKFHRLKLVFNGDGTFDILYDGITKVTNIPFGVFNGGLHNNASFSNRMAYLSGSTSGTNIGGYLKKFQGVLNIDGSSLTINNNDRGIPYTLKIPDTELRSMSLQIPDFGYPQGTPITIENQSKKEAYFTRENDIPVIDGKKSDFLVFGETTVKLIATGKGYTWDNKSNTNLEALRTGLIAYSALTKHATTPFTVVIPDRTMRFVDKVAKTSQIITKPAVNYTFTGDVNLLGVVHFYEDVDGNILALNDTNWSTPVQTRRYVSLGNADINLAKDDFVQANNPLVSAYGLLDAFGDYLSIGGSIKGNGGDIHANSATNTMGLDIDGYTAVAYGRNFDDEETPHTPVSTDITDADLHLGYKTSDEALLFGNVVKNIDPSNYQKIEDITLTTVPAGKYTIQRLYQFPGTDYNMVIYGSTLYDNLEQAKKNASTEGYNLHPSLVPACFLGYIIVRNDVTNLETAITDGEAAIINYDGRNHPQTNGAEATDQDSIIGLAVSGNYSNLSTQTFATTTSAYIVLFDTIIQNRNISFENNSEIVFLIEGLYSITVNSQLYRNGSGGSIEEIKMWAQKSEADTPTNFVNTPGDTSRATVRNDGDKVPASLTMDIEVKKNERVRFMAQVGSTQLELKYEPPQASPAISDTPSCRLNVAKIN